jgi:hypothetical protein
MTQAAGTEVMSEGLVLAVEALTKLVGADSSYCVIDDRVYRETRFGHRERVLGVEIAPHVLAECSQALAALRSLAVMGGGEGEGKEGFSVSRDHAHTAGVRLDRDVLIDLIMRETTDEIVADEWDKLGSPNILVQGCRYVRNDPKRGYVDPESAARKFASLIADALIAHVSSPAVNDVSSSRDDPIPPSGTHQ